MIAAAIFILLGAAVSLSGLFLVIVLRDASRGLD